MKGQSRTRNSIVNSITSITTQILTVVMNFIVKIVFVRVISMEYLGVNGLFSNIITMLSLADLGLGTAIPYSLYGPLAHNDKNKINVLMNFYAKVYNIIGTVVIIVGLGLIPFLPALIKDGQGVPNLYLIYSLYVIHSASSYFFVYKKMLIDADQKSAITARIVFVFSFLLSLVQIFVLIVFKNFILFLVSAIVFVVLQNIYISIKANKMYPYIKKKTNEKMDKKDLNSIIKNVSALFIYKVGNVVTNGTDNLVISKFLGLIPVGIYSNYILIVNSLITVTNQLFNAITSSIGNLVATSNSKHSEDVFNKLVFINFWIYSVFSVLLLILFNSFIKICFGTKFVTDISVVFALVYNFYIFGMQTTPNSYITAYGLFYKNKWRPVFMIITNIVVSIILVKYLGILGVVLGTIASRIFTTAWMDPYIVYRHGFKMNPFNYYVSYLKYILIFTIVGFSMYYLSTFIVISNLIVWILVGIVSFIIINALYVLIFYRSGEFKYFYDKFKPLVMKLIRH